MDVFEAIHQRRAVRAYTPEPVEKDTIERLIMLAIQAPSAMNIQPWAFAVIRGGERLSSLSDRAKSHLLRTMAAGSPLEHYRSNLSDPAFNIFYDASILVVVSATSREEGASEDCALAAQNFMLAAHALELGTCWIGFARGWLNEPAAKAELGLPAGHFPVAPIIVGHPRGRPETHPRRKPEIIWIGG
ncbi:MAG TPA: nitroreductase [Hyphomicrobiaceae bacterium]|nr:nitroreductase [Hyphomicrobiaceae bacterium]